MRQELCTIPGCHELAKIETPFTKQKVCRSCWINSKYTSKEIAIDIYVGMRLFGLGWYEVDQKEININKDISIPIHKGFLGDEARVISVIEQTGLQWNQKKFNEINWNNIQHRLLYWNNVERRSEIIQRIVDLKWYYSVVYNPSCECEGSIRPWRVKIVTSKTQTAVDTNNENESLFLALWDILHKDR